MTDIHNLQAFALYMQKTDIRFDLYSVTKEMEKQVLPLLFFPFTFKWMNLKLFIISFGLLLFVPENIYYMFAFLKTDWIRIRLCEGGKCDG